MSAEGYQKYLYSNFAPSTMHKRCRNIEFQKHYEHCKLNAHDEYICETQTYCQNCEHLTVDIIFMAHMQIVV